MSDEMAEAPRPDPGFRVFVEQGYGMRGGGKRIDVTDAVMDVYDIAVGSMDFGSGFLSTEEVGHLRVLGNAIGAKKFDYQHDKCLRCGHDVERHAYKDGRPCSHGKFGRYDEECSCAGYVTPV